MKKAIIIQIIMFTMCCFVFEGCADQYAEPLKPDQFEGIILSEPEGSGSVRTLRLCYRNSYGEMVNSEVMSDVSGVVSAQYDSEAKEQTITSSDFNGDGVVEVIVFREFWFEDLKLPHVAVPQWPTVYEYILGQGFVVASSKYKEWFEEYAQEQERLLAKDNTELLENGTFVYHGKGDYDEALLARLRLLYVAKKIADGTFIPKQDYAVRRYEDVADIAKALKQKTVK